MTNSEWTKEKEAEALLILKDDDNVQRNQRYYHVRHKFEMTDYRSWT